jgi:hypothetical protein
MTQELEGRKAIWKQVRNENDSDSRTRALKEMHSSENYLISKQESYFLFSSKSQLLELWQIWLEK